MKKIITTILLLLIAISSSYAMMGYGNGMGNQNNYNQNNYNQNTYQDEHMLNITNYAYEELSQDEINSLLYMREEEKLAQDVYLEMYDLYNLNVFSNIARSETMHTNMVLQLLNKYNITDPASSQRGVFENQELQNLYNDLIAKGNQNITSALEVGATIEDVDILDLQNQIAKVDNKDIISVYENLLKGSRNHMRSFTSNLNNYGITYEPQYISQDYYNLILSSNNEMGMVNGEVEMGMMDEVNSYEDMQEKMNEHMGVDIQRNDNNFRENQNNNNWFTNIWRGFRGWFTMN